MMLHLRNKTKISHITIRILKARKSKLSSATISEILTIIMFTTRVIPFVAIIYTVRTVRITIILALHANMLSYIIDDDLKTDLLKDNRV